VRLFRILVGGAAASLVFAPLAALAVPQPGHAPPALSLPAASGKKPVSLDALKGKPVYVNFFASWCGPCNVEAPSIAKLRSQYGTRMRFVGVDELDGDGQGVAFEKKYNDPYDLVAVDNSGKVGRDYGTTIFMPIHVFIDRHGVVKTYRMGEMNPAEIEAAIKDALK